MYKRVLIKLSGESLMNEKENINKEKVQELTNLFKQVRELGIELGIVIGGGNFFRGRSNQDMYQLYVDSMGMLGTCMNALGLMDGFKKNNVNAIFSTPFNLNNLYPTYTQEELNNLIKDNVIVFGGGTGNIGCSTDTASSNKAKLINADVIIKLTNVDGVYDKDPNKYEDAKLYKSLTFKEVLDNPEIKVMDIGAIEECKENNIEIRVINFNDKNNLLESLKGKEIGTRIYNDK